ncbi:MAG: 2-aminoadipate transaminase [Actinomycetota bacterium]|nr:2-aminoadipate transaminase [Actinomycetota bacterium]
MSDGARLTDPPRKKDERNGTTAQRRGPLTSSTGQGTPERPESGGSRLDPHHDRYAERARTMTASEIRALFAVASRPEVVSLAGGMPYLRALPLEEISALVARLLAEQGAEALQYSSGQGDPQLREQICTVMSLVGIAAHPDEVVVTTGSQQALDLVTRIFVDPGDVVLVEAPSYVGALGTFRSFQAEVRHVAMDSEGLVPDALREALAQLRGEGRQAKFLYTVPSFHNPAGVTAPAARRAETLAICREAGLLVLEDDPYGLLGFDGQPPRAIRADDDEGVVYLGSFSKTFAPGLRVGWALAPHAVRDKLVLASEATQLCPSAYSQLTVSAYLRTQPWQEQVKVYREVYRERRDAILAALTDLMPPGSTWTRPEGGFYVWLTLPEGIDAARMLPLAVSERVAYVPGSAFYAGPVLPDEARRSMRLSYCYPEPDRIREGVRRLAGVVERELELRATFGGRNETAAGTAGPAADTA